MKIPHQVEEDRTLEIIRTGIRRITIIHLLQQNIPIMVVIPGTIMLGNTIPQMETFLTKDITTHKSSKWARILAVSWDSTIINKDILSNITPVPVGTCQILEYEREHNTVSIKLFSLFLLKRSRCLFFLRQVKTTFFQNAAVFFPDEAIFQVDVHNMHDLLEAFCPREKFKIKRTVSYTTP
mmetsp:Transcript_34091/g.50081  ORF Transcript_34091/g.50081 Transcript_34091/m.50081 type:complete len:181 (+) Transcript_34091:127-669(+)